MSRHLRRTRRFLKPVDKTIARFYVDTCGFVVHRLTLSLNAFMLERSDLNLRSSHLGSKTQRYIHHLTLHSILTLGIFNGFLESEVNFLWKNHNLRQNKLQR